MAARTIRSVLAIAAMVTAASAGAVDRPTAAVAHLAESPAIDGIIGEAEWEGATVLDEPFVQVEPEFGAPSPFRTVIRIAQTETALFVAIAAFDPDPYRLSVAATARDGDMDRDDSVGVMLDTFLDGRTAYVFRTNALATQWDATLANNGRTVDKLWDVEWRCAAHRFGDRWTAEFEIPFSVLRFRRGGDRSALGRLHSVRQP